MHIQAAAPTSVCLQQARGGSSRSRDSIKSALTSYTGIVLATTFISLSLCFLWLFLITEKRKKKAEWTGESMVDNTHTPEN